MKIIKYIFCILAINSPFCGFGQVMEYGVRTANLGIMVQPKTFGVDLKFSKALENRFSRVFDFDLISLKHPKEQKVTNQRYQNSNPFVYGKLNDFLSLRAGVGIKKVIGERVSRNTVNVSLVGIAGVNIGFLKPVFLEVSYVDTFGVETREFEAYDPNRHDGSNIVGAAGFSYGFGGLKIEPGFYGKAGIEFGWGNYKTSYISLELGVTTDLFFREVPIMNFAKNRSIYPGFYATFALVKIY